MVQFSESLRIFKLVEFIGINLSDKAVMDLEVFNILSASF